MLDTIIVYVRVRLRLWTGRITTYKYVQCCLVQQGGRTCKGERSAIINVGSGRCMFVIARLPQLLQVVMFGGWAWTFVQHMFDELEDRSRL